MKKKRRPTIHLSGATSRVKNPLTSKISSSHGGPWRDFTVNDSEKKISAEEGRKDTSSQGFRPLSKASQERVMRAVEYATRRSQFRPRHSGESHIFNEFSYSYDNICNGEFGTLILKVRRGKWLSEPHYCADCKNIFNPIWRYQDSNYGSVHLCTPCKVVTFERCFGYADAMPLKVDHAHAHKGKW